MPVNLTELYSSGNNPNILGRDKEVEALMITLLRREKPNALLIGEPGVGKTSVIHQLAYLIANDLVPKELKSFKVVELNTNELIAGPGYRGVTEQKFQDVIDTALKQQNVILFFDEFHTVETLGQLSNGSTPGLGNTLKPYLTRPDFHVVGATTTDEFKEIKDKALLRRFALIKIEEPNEEAVKNIIKACLIEYGEGIKFEKAIIQTIFDLGKSLSGFNPDKSKDFVDFLCSYARFKDYTKITINDCSNIIELYKMAKVLDYVPKKEPKQKGELV